MTDKEVRKLSRGELLEMLLGLSEEKEKLEQQLAAANEKLADRRICLNEAGSIAEAALSLNGIFSAAQNAADQYLESLRLLMEDQNSLRERIEGEAKVKCDQMLAEAHAEANRLCAEAETFSAKVKAEAEQKRAETEKHCAELLAEAEAKSEAYWQDVSTRLEHFYQEHHGLRELLCRVPGEEA